MPSQEQLDIDAATAEIEQTNGVIPSALALIDWFVATVEAAKSDRNALNAAVATMKDRRDALAAAVAANPIPSPDPAPTPDPQPA